MRQLALITALLVTAVVCTGCKKKVLVPEGTPIVYPILLNYKCSMTFVSENKLQKEQRGTVVKEMECPSATGSATHELSQIENTEGELFWVETKDTISDH